MRAPLTAACVLTLVSVPAEAAAAADGRMGQSSTGSIAIRVSVAPRAWQAASGTLCVAAPPAGYSLRLASGSASLEWADAPASAACSGRATPVELHPAGEGQATLLIAAE